MKDNLDIQKIMYEDLKKEIITICETDSLLLCDIEYILHLCKIFVDRNNYCFHEFKN